MAATLRDVAAHAGVSIRTVSNVVSDHPHVSDSTRARVQQAIKELGYRPNPVAQTLRTGRTGALLLVVPEINVPYFSELAKEIIVRAAERSFSITITQTSDATADEALTPGGRAALFDGILYASKMRPETLKSIDAAQTPVVMLGEDIFDGAHDHVAIDSAQAAVDAVTHLASLGYTKIAAVGPQPEVGFSTPARRLSGYMQEMARQGLTVNDDLIAPTGPYSRRTGYETSMRLLRGSNRPDALLCFSDLLAIGALRAAHDLGYRVPGDVAVVGIDDVPEGRFCIPSLTTISLDIPFIAAQAVQMIADRLDDPQRPPREIIAPHSLIERESSCGTLSHI